MSITCNGDGREFQAEGKRFSRSSSSCGFHNDFCNIEKSSESEEEINRKKHKEILLNQLKAEKPPFGSDNNVMPSDANRHKSKEQRTDLTDGFVEETDSSRFRRDFLSMKDGEAI